MNAWVVILLLPLAAWSGWWIGMRKEARDLRQSKSRSAYFEGLSFLLNDQTDQAVDVFLNMAEMDKQTFDNQLTLGALFRKRGELDRALHLHRQLADLPGLDNLQICAVEYELAEDYMHSGMFRQAQALLENLSGQNFRNNEVYAILRRIYERTSQWEKAIDISKRWQEIGYEGGLEQQIAHYHCQLAEAALENGCTAEANSRLEAALQTDRRCGRAYWMQAELAAKRGEHVTAIHNYHSIAEQASDFLPDILPYIAESYRAIDRYDEYLMWLLDKEETLNQVRLTLATADTLAQLNASAAYQLIAERLQKDRNPLLLAAYLHYSNTDAAQNIYAITGKAITPRTLYQCNECGFRHQKVVWHCPACQAWSSFRPLIELKLEQR